MTEPECADIKASSSSASISGVYAMLVAKLRRLPMRDGPTEREEAGYDGGGISSGDVRLLRLPSSDIDCDLPGRTSMPADISLGTCLPLCSRLEYRLLPPAASSDGPSVASCKREFTLDIDVPDVGAVLILPGSDVALAVLRGGEEVW